MIKKRSVGFLDRINNFLGTNPVTGPLWSTIVGDRNGYVYHRNQAQGYLEQARSTKYSEHRGRLFNGAAQNFSQADETAKAKGAYINAAKAYRDAANEVGSDTKIYMGIKEAKIRKKGGTSHHIIHVPDYRVKREEFSKKAIEARLNARKMHEALSERSGGLEREASVAAVIATVGILGGIFFISSNLTGYVIGNISQISSNWIGGALFIIGLVGAFAYFNQKRNAKK